MDVDAETNTVVEKLKKLGNEFCKSIGFKMKQQLDFERVKSYFSMKNIGCEFNIAGKFKSQLDGFSYLF